MRSLQVASFTNQAQKLPEENCVTEFSTRLDLRKEEPIFRKYWKLWMATKIYSHPKFGLTRKLMSYSKASAMYE